MNDSAPDDALKLPAAADVAQAAGRIASFVRRTPVATSASLDRRFGGQAFCKCENLQRSGAFKFRGASNAVWALDEAQARLGVATHSSGNHGAALALAAKERGVPAHVVIPEGAVQTKVEAVEDFGASVHRCAPNQAAREAGLEQVLQDTGATRVHPYDQSHIIAGQGTAALELLEEVPDLDAIIVPIGGGGLAAGTVLAAAAHDLTIDVFAAEPQGADEALRSLQAGRRITEQKPDTIADGLRATIGEMNFQILQPGLADVLPVTDAQTVAAMQLVWSRMKLIIEPSAAVAVAGLLRHREQFAGRRVGIIFSGGNLDLHHLPW